MNWRNRMLWAFVIGVALIGLMCVLVATAKVFEALR
jgi:hypothetical protein